MARPSAEPKAASSKDKWDKAGIIAQALIPALLAIFTAVYRHIEKQQSDLEAAAAARLEEEKARTLKANTVVSLLPNLPIEADSLKVPMIAAILESLGYGDVSLRLVTARAKPTVSSVAALRDLTKSDSTSVANGAKQALSEIAQTVAAGDTAVAMQAVTALTQTASTQPNAGPEWAVVTGNYANLAGAYAAADSSRRLGFSTDVFQRNNALRTAIRFPNRSIACVALPLIRGRVRRGAYGVNWEDWCPGVRSVDNHFKCDPSAPERPLGCT